MKFSDRASGLLVMIVGAVIAIYARTFPHASGQSIGPGMFPTLIGAGLLAFGAVLMASDLRTGPAPWAAVDAWVRRPRMALNFVVVVLDLAFYALAADTLGFFITASIFLLVLFAAFGVKLRTALLVSAVATFAIHYAFYTLLRVPLPWGLFESVAW